jgi:hypothetical protein
MTARTLGARASNRTVNAIEVQPAEVGLQANQKESRVGQRRIVVGVITRPVRSPARERKAGAQRYTNE